MFFSSLCCVPAYIVTITNVSPRDDIRLCVLKTKVKWNKLKTLTVVWGFDLIFHAREDSGWHPAVTKHRRWYCLEFILKELFSAVSRYWQQMTRTKPVLKNVLAHHSHIWSVHQNLIFSICIHLHNLCIKCDVLCKQSVPRVSTISAGILHKKHQTYSILSVSDSSLHGLHRGGQRLTPTIYCLNYEQMEKQKKRTVEEPPNHTHTFTLSLSLKHTHTKKM